jgi:NB-ARC domain
LDRSTEDRAQVTVIAGMGGVGKTTLVTAIAHDPEIQQRFSDGILWADLYEQRNVLSILNTWVQALGDRNFKATYPESASIYLRTLLSNKAVLLVIDGLDDISNLVVNGLGNDSDSSKTWLFLVGGKQCHVLITSRNRSIVSTSEAAIYVLDVMTPEESVGLLTSSLERSLDGTERDEALRVAQTLGHLPLALSLAAAQIRRGVSWADLEKQLSGVRRLLAEHGSDRRRLNDWC